jgi:DNA-binding response OmpR family regulator
MAERDAPSRRATILIIEDDDVTATDLHNELIGAGYFVRRARSAHEARITLRSTQADLVLMSLMLPDADGLVLCSALRAQFPAPIIVLTKRQGAVDRLLAFESGATDCVIKPVDRDELLALVKAVVQSPVSA